MVTQLLQKIFGSRNQRLLKRMQKGVASIGALEAKLETLPQTEFKAYTDRLKARFQSGEPLEALLPEAFALVRVAAKCTLNMRHFDVQLLGGMALHEGNISEMRTGEGKTLVATLPAYLNALTGKGVHVVTVNDYLAKRDAEWMKPIFEYLGVTVGVNLAGMSPEEKRAAYACDITYGTNNEFGFDYLRDNMAFSLEDKVLRPLHYAIVDEVDCILIDEARTPLVISGQAEDSSELYRRVNEIIPKLKVSKAEGDDGDYTLDEKSKQAFLTEIGHEHAENFLREAGLLGLDDSLYSPTNISIVHHLNAALRAHTLFRRNVEYLIQGGKVVIVDEHTGRTMPGRRWSDGLHQAIEAKEGVNIQNESQTLASITLQNYFRLYEKLAGMTGTADTEAYEFQQIYGLEVVVVPTHKANQRVDHSDLIFLTSKAKFKAILEDIKSTYEAGQPVLVGTASIETSEFLSKLLTQAHIPHQVLNAKYHEKEAQIIAQAGRPKAVTIATNMAGRGTDIVLGGSVEAEIAALEAPSLEAIAEHRAQWQKRHEQVVALGGLYVLGTERHESRRIDNQLRGRSGRQGDPGKTRFYLSLEDTLMRIFASERVALLMQRFGMQEDEAIEHSLVTRAIENAQRKVEAHHFDIRKQLLEYDDVANEQRKVIYEERNALLANSDISSTVVSFFEDVGRQVCFQYLPAGSFSEVWNSEGLMAHLEREFLLPLPIKEWTDQDNELDEQGVAERVVSAIKEAYTAKERTLEAKLLRHFEKAVMLQLLDTYWKDHLAAMDYLRQGIHLRGYAQKNPKQEYKREAFLLLENMLDTLKVEVVSTLLRMQVKSEQEVAAVEAARKEAAKRPLEYTHPETQLAVNLADERQEEQEVEKTESAPFVREAEKVGRNDPCPCGSGRKYKHCCGQITA